MQSDLLKQFTTYVIRMYILHVVLLVSIIFNGVFIIKKIAIPDNWQYEEARKLFAEPEVLDSKDVVVRSICVSTYLSRVVSDTLSYPVYT